MKKKEKKIFLSQICIFSFLVITMNNKYLLGPAVVVTSRRIYVLALVFLFTSAAGTATSTIGGKNGKV